MEDFASEFARMISLLSSRVFVLSIGCLLLAVKSPAADWPQWRGPLRTGYVPSGEPVPEKLPAEPSVVWKIKIGEGLASPVIASGRVFYFDNQNGKETLHAIDAVTAKEFWREAVDDPFSDMQGPTGPRCTPLVDGERVYAQSCKGELQCRKVVDGKLIWRVNFTNDFGAVFIGEKGNIPGAARHGNNGSPVIDGENMIAAVGGTNGAGIVCFKKRTGEVVWKSQNDQAAFAAPMVATIAGVKQVVSFTVDGLVGLDVRDGNLLWRVPMKTAFGRHVTAPVIVDDIVLVASHQVGLVATKIAKGAAGLKAEQAWLSKESAMNFSCPVAVGKYLYGLGPNKNIVCVDVATGKQMWSKEGFFTSSAEKAHAGFLVMDRNILVLTDGGQLILVAADPAECKEISRAQVCGFNWCNPAYAEGKLFLRDGVKGSGELICFGLVP